MQPRWPLGIDRHLKSPTQVTGGPAWAGVQTDSMNLDTKATRFDITAKAEGDTPPKVEAFRLMLRTLLEDRFQLRLRSESRETRVYGLVVDKGGPKFKESASRCRAWATSMRTRSSSVRY